MPLTLGRLFGTRPRWSSTAIRCSSSCSWARRIASAARSAASWSSERSVGLNDRPDGSSEAQVADGRPLDHERHLPPAVAVGAGLLARDRAHLAAGDAHHPRLVVLAGDLHLRRLDPEQLGQPCRQLRQELVELERLERRREVLELRQPLGDRLGLHARGLFEQQVGPVLLGAAADGQIDPLRQQQRLGELGRLDRGRDHRDPHLRAGARSQAQVDGRLVGADKPRAGAGDLLERRRQRRPVLEPRTARRPRSRSGRRALGRRAGRTRGSSGRSGPQRRARSCRSERPRTRRSTAPRSASARAGSPRARRRPRPWSGAARGRTASAHSRPRQPRTRGRSPTPRRARPSGTRSGRPGYASAP